MTRQVGTSTTREKTYGPGLGDGPRYLGIDQSYSGFGLAVLTEDGGYEAVVRKFSGTGISRLLEIEYWLDECLRYFNGPAGDRLVNAAIEAPVLRSPNALLAGQLYSIVLRKLALTAAVVAVRYPLQVPPTTLKKYITGKGSADKNQILLQTYKRFGAEFDNDNAADAYGLARIAAGMFENKVDQEVLQLLEDPKFRE